MSSRYTAAAKKNPGRKSWLVEFRHPLKMDNSNKPGKKTRKGLGTEDEQEALRLTAELNELLSDETLWSIGSQAGAAKRFDPRVLEIFYDEIAPRSQSAVQLRDKFLPLPSHDDGYAKVALLGVPGAGKTTLLRQLIGTHPEKERFPATSVNRTTTYSTELILTDSPHYRAVVSFMSEHETRFEIEESLAAALVKAIDNGDQKVADTLLEKSDMRFRLKYMLGELGAAAEELDPYTYDDEESQAAPETQQTELAATSEEKSRSQELLKSYVSRIVSIARDLKAQIETTQGPLSEMSTDDRNAAMDLIEEMAVASDAFLELTSDILDELRSKFDLASGDGKFEKTNTGWPRAWHIETPAWLREQFLSSMRYFSGIAHQSWGKLLTPLVNGMRVSGPFKPSWSDDFPRLVLIDTEGLGHKAGATADLSEQTLTLLHDVDVVLLVDSAKNSMTNFAAGKALEGIVNTGHTQKLAVVFTHMDAVIGDNLKGKSKLDHIFGGIRNVAENQLAKNISNEAARHLLQHLESSTFYVGRIDKADPRPAIPELTKLLKHLSDAQPPIFEPVSFPRYSSDNLVLAIQEASKDFRHQWNGRLGLASSTEFAPSPWQSIKALSRRYAEGWEDGFYLRPVANLFASLSAAISRFLENPIEWSGHPTEAQKRKTIDSIKVAVTTKIYGVSTHRLRELPQPAWHEAYALRGGGSTFERRQRIGGIFARYVPIPDAKGDKLVFEFLDEIKGIVMRAIEELEQDVVGKS